jgi:hypothetical protein
MKMSLCRLGKTSPISTLIMAIMPHMAMMKPTNLIKIGRLVHGFEGPK